MKTETELSVRFQECDMGGVVHHSVYAIWYEAARMEFFERLNMSYHQQRDLGLILPVVDLHVVFRAPVRFPGRVKIVTSIASYAPRKIALHYALYCDGVLANEAETLQIWTDLAAWKSVDLEQTHPELYAAIAAAAEDTEN